MKPVEHLPEVMQHPGRAVVILSLALVVIAGVFYREEVLEFIDSLLPTKMEATITFGQALDSSGQSVVGPTTSFRLGENVAWVVRFRERAAAHQLVVALFQIATDGKEILLDRNSMTVEPSDIGLYNLSTTQAFWSLSPKDMESDVRTYRVKYIKDKVVAQGDFSIVTEHERKPGS